MMMMTTTTLALVPPPFALPRQIAAFQKPPLLFAASRGRHSARVHTAAAATAVPASPEPRGINPATVKKVLGGAAALGLGVAVAPVPTFFILRVAALIWPLYSAVRLWRDGRRRSAISLTLMTAARRFGARWWQYATIPLFAGAVGWVTNKVAVDMIFAPINFWGIPIKRFPNQPLGWIGWQGIAPCKAGVMAGRLTDIVTSQLLEVKEVFARISPARFSELLSPGVDRIAEQVVAEMMPAQGRGVAIDAARGALRGLPVEAQRELGELRLRYVRDIVRDVQANAGEMIDLDELMVSGMVREKQLLVDLFKRCGKSELSFLVNSGLSFGMALGVIQMLIWLFYERAWTLAAGGAIVGYLTNLIALKLIFEPVEPTRIGPFMMQGMFLRRQNEVSEEFADCLTEKLLSSESLFEHMLSRPAFADVLHKRTQAFMAGCAAVLYGGTEYAQADGYWSALESRVSGRVLKLLPTELPLVHGYCDAALDIQQTLKTRLRTLTPQQFEQVLHPVFQEDEFTLVMVGAVLGLIVGYGQLVWDRRDRAATAAAAAAAGESPAIDVEPADE